VSVLLLDTVAKVREATEGRKETLETVTLAQDNMVWESFFEGGVKPLSSGRLALTVSTGSIRSGTFGHDGTCLTWRYASANPQRSIRSSRSLHSPQPDRLHFPHQNRDTTLIWSPSISGGLAPAGTMSAKHGEVTFRAGDTLKFRMIKTDYRWSQQKHETSGEMDANAQWAGVKNGGHLRRGVWELFPASCRDITVRITGKKSARKPER